MSIVTVMMVLLAALFYIMKLETKVSGEGLYIRFFPMHVSFRKFAPGDISECYPRQYRPIIEYGGWGIRYGREGKAYNISGNEGVQLVMKNGKKLLVGSQKHLELAEAINSIINPA